MARRRRGLSLALGLAAGLLLGALLRLSARRTGACAPLASPAAAVQLGAAEDPHNSNRTLVLVGVMTAAQYLGTRARAVRDTWARDLPGRLALFSSEGSAAAPGLVALRGVDDSYPPQKKSFLMLLHMHEHYGERFEWFMRADDDVYVRGDRLEALLRAVDSRKPQFIGQAGRGAGDERDALALGYDENFCMGGPGVLLSRETLRRVAPHVRYCLRHLYSTHEDVELGRCVAKFAGVSCTWSYDMQTILHHNSSGAAAYTGRLKRKEVHRAITLHPVKDYRHMYRIHSYFKNYRIRELREQALELHRDIAGAARELRVPRERVAGYRLREDTPLFPAPAAALGYLGDNAVLGVPPGLTRYRPERVQDILTWDYVSKSIYSHRHSNPKRRIETSVKEALDDVIREVMQLINAASRQRGRVIDFNEILYGYTRLDPLHGADHVLDILLRYRRYRGRKMTASVRRHAYLQQSFTGMEIRELPMGKPPPLDDQLLLEKMGKSVGADYQEYDASSQQQSAFNLDKFNIPIKEALETGLMKLQENLPNILQWTDDDVKEYSVYNREIKFILPLSGRLEILVRFMKNYEDIVLKSDEVASLIVVLYVNNNSPQEFEHTVTLINFYKQKYTDKEIKIINMSTQTFSRGAAITEGLKACSSEDLAFFIDVDMMFNFETLRRIRINTIKHTQVYFPIVFSEYNPTVVGGEDYNKFKSDILVTDTDVGRFASYKDLGEKSERELANIKYSKQINDDLGYFRQYGFGILSAYKCDVENVGGFNLTIKGWGMEDVQLFETMIKSNLTVFRMADDSLVHIFHSVDCDKSLEKSQYQMCLGTMASTYGSEKHMTYYMLNHPHILWPPGAGRGAS